MPTQNLVARAALAPLVPLNTGTGAECHLIVDTAATRLTVILARADVAVIDAVCRSVLGTLHVSVQTTS